MASPNPITVPLDVRSHLAGFIAPEEARYGYTVLRIDPLEILREMYSVGLDPVHIIHVTMYYRSLQDFGLDALLDALNSLVSWKISHDQGNNLTTIQITPEENQDIASIVREWLQQRSGNVNEKVEPSTDRASSRVKYLFSVLDPNASLFQAIVNVDDDRCPTRFNIYRRDLGDLIDPVRFMSSLPMPRGTEDDFYNLYDRMIELGINPSRMIAQRRLDQRELRTLMLRPEWQIFLILEALLGSDNRYWSLRPRLGNPERVVLGVSTLKRLQELIQAMQNLGVADLRLPGGNTITIPDPNHVIARYLKRVTELLTDPNPKPYNLLGTGSGFHIRSYNRNLTAKLRCLP